MTEKNYYRHYSPSVPAAVIFTIFFIFAFVAHVVRLFKTRTWFCTPFVIGALFEIVGFVARALGNGSPSSLKLYVMQSLFILLAPILFAASVYMFLGRIIRVIGHESQSLIRPTRLTKIFVGGDVVCFLIQAMGAGMLASSKSASSSDRGKKIILLGLVLQILIFGFFVLVAVVFHVRVQLLPVGMKMEPWSWQRFLGMLYLVSGIITIRNLFRVAEYAMGEDGYLLTREWPIYLFDALPMTIVLGISWLWYVGDIVKRYNVSVAHGNLELGARY